MKFGAVYMAVWTWIIPALVVFYFLAHKWRKKALRKFADEDLLSEIGGSVNSFGRKFKKVLIVIALLFMVVALLRPQWGFTWQEVKKQGLDILVALDTSNSMLAEDVLPNRLQRAKLAVRDLVEKLKGDRIGLIAFSGNAFLQCPLTVDYNGFLLTLDDVDVDSVPVGGTSISKAIYTALNSYEGGKKRNKVLIIITDGEDLEGGVEGAIQQARAAGVKIFCLGIGTSGGELIPVVGGRGKMVFLKDTNGEVVRTQLMEDALQRIALETGGMYVRSAGAELGLDIIYDEKLSKMEKQEIKSKMEKHFHERFQIPLAIAFLLVCLEPLIGDRKRKVK